MATDLSSILKLEVPVSVQIASRRMSLREISNLAPGAIIELPKTANEQLEIIVSNREIGVGKAVKVGENFGVRVTHIGNVKERLKALSGEPTAPTAPEATADESPDDSAAPAESDTADEASQESHAEAARGQ